MEKTKHFSRSVKQSDRRGRREIKNQVPTDYKEFIKDHNGCSPIDKKVVLFQNSRESINNLLSIGDPTRPIDLFSTFDNVKGRLVDKIIPFATDVGETSFVLITEYLLKNLQLFFGIMRSLMKIRKFH
ncbi:MULTISPECIES: SMI1/KNR4 family protein [unclassified Bacillus (in: firmicutes)]|uniref:SMI1/KNR4 family protein n=1 Tax=unclassified Bacillus (in: firmicutes) TaxID=185979 RepID=UPI0030FAC4BE